MEKGTRTQTLPDRLPFETDGPTTGARHEYQHCWPLWQPNQTAHFPALAITRVSGLTTNPGAKAFAPHLLKTHECRANNALLSRTYCRAIFVHKMERSEMHKNAAQYVSDAAICYVLLTAHKIPYLGNE